MVRVRTWAVAVVSLYAVGAAAQPAAPDPKAAALFERGRDQLKRGETEAACGSFAESLAIEQADGTELNLADCQERLGHLADAWRMFEQTATLSASKGNTVRADAARARAAALLPKIGQVAITIAEPNATGLAITVAGQTVSPSGQIQRKVDPGAVAIRATQPGHEAFEQSVSVEAGGVATVEIPARPVDTGAPPAKRSDASLRSVVDKQPAATSTHRRHSRVVLSEVLGGGGVALVGAGVVIGVIANSHYKSQFSSGACVKMGSAIDCTVDGANAASSAVKLGDAGTVVGAVGVAAAVAAGVLWFTAPIEVSVTPQSASVAVVGRF